LIRVYRRARRTFAAVKVLSERVSARVRSFDTAEELGRGHSAALTVVAILDEYSTAPCQGFDHLVRVGRRLPELAGDRVRGQRAIAEEEQVDLRLQFVQADLS
jgi:hypothetical protein